MLGVIVNTIAVIIGSAVGLLFKKGVSKKFSDAIMIAIGLCTLFIGISGSLKGENTIIVILAMVLGAALGTAIDIDGAVNKLGLAFERKFSRGDGQPSIARGFVTASLLFCVGAMTIVGSLTAGLTGDNTMLYTKSVLDFISAIMLSVSLGFGVMLSALFVLVFQGLIALFSGVLAPVLTDAAVNELICAGSLLITALGLNLLGITKIKVADFLPALFFAPFFVWLLSVLPQISF